LRSGSSAALLLLAVCAVLVSCGSVARNSRDVVLVVTIPFTEVATTGQSRHDDGPAVAVGWSDASRDSIIGLVPAAAAGADRVLVAAFQGQQRTGGYGIAIAKVELVNDELRIHAVLSAPPKDAFVTQVLTSPAQVVSVARSDIAGAKTAILLDPHGAELARASIA
jgi:hypothetical protein